MTIERYYKKLEVPQGRVDVLLDTDAYNEVDDQYAIAYLLRCGEKLNVKAITAAPFSNIKVSSPKEGMELSYNEILNILSLAERNDLVAHVFKGSEKYLPNEKTPVISDAANEIVRLADEHSEDDPLYVVAIGAITNVAAALLIKPNIKDRIVVVWLGGTAFFCDNAAEFNLKQDVAAVRVVFNSGVPLVQLPCRGIVESFRISEADIRMWMLGKNKLCDYLGGYTIKDQEEFHKMAGKPWTRVIWDVTAVAWLLNDNNRFMDDKLVHAPIVTYDRYYAFDDSRHYMKYVYNIKRDALVEDMFNRLTSN